MTRTTERLVLAVDCSTTAAKAVALDGAGRVVAQAAHPLDLSRPGPGRHEQDAEQWWTATTSALADTVAALGPADAGRVAAVAITHQRESFVCLDADGRPLRPAILWLDSRADAEIAELGSDRVRDLSGKPPDVTPALYKLAWLARHEPSMLAGAARVAEVHGFLAARLTGRWATSLASADSLGLLDLRNGTWSPELLELAGVRRDQLPDLVPPGAVIGPVRADVATRLGLPHPVPLVAGIGDGQAAGLGAAVTETAAPRTGYLNLGTSMVMGVPSAGYLTGPAFRTLAGAPAGTYVLETVLNAASYLATWFRREFGDPALGGEVDPALEAAAAAVAPGAEGLLTVPYWNCAQTPYWDTAARGVTLGWHGGHTRAHLYRSLLEGVAFELRLHLDGLEAATGARVEVLRAMGGGSRSPLWTQIVADVTGRPVQLCAGGEISARGAGVLALAATGDPAGDPDGDPIGAPDGDPTGSDRRAGTSDLGAAIAAAAEAMAAFGATVTPRPLVTDRYDRLFAVQRTVYPHLREVFAELARA